MGNVSSGHKRRSSLEDDPFTGSYIGKRLTYQYSQDTHGDDSVISILADGTHVNAIADQLRESRLYDSYGKPTLYVGAPGGTPDVFEEPQPIQSVPTVFKWEGGGKDVYISGTFNGWKSKIQMVRSSSKHNFYTIIDLPLGEHQYKFIVDGHWKLDQSQPICTNPSGVQNNVIEVKESDFDVLAALSHDMANSRGTTTGEDSGLTSGGGGGAIPNLTSGEGRFEGGVGDLDSVYIPGSSSPPGEYGRVIPSTPLEALSLGTTGSSGGQASNLHGGISSSDAKKSLSPPSLPPQLLQVILNRDTNVQCDPNLLPQPDHVMVNHMYALSIKDGVIVLSAITRYRQKFVSTVLYKPI